MDVTKPYEFIAFGPMDATKPYEFVGFGTPPAHTSAITPDPVDCIGSQGSRSDIDGPKPYKLIGFGDIDGPKPYKFTGFGAIDGIKPFKFIGFGAIDGQRSTGYR